jgi:hypothetical protein
VDPLELMHTRAEELQREHAKIATAPEFRQALARLSATTADFVATIRGSWLFATREPGWKERLYWIGTDDLVASAVGINALVSNGVRNPARRELRFSLESAVKYLYVDEELSRKTPLATRLRFLERQVPAKSIDPLNAIQFEPVLGSASAMFKKAVWNAYGDLSEYVHLSDAQVAEHIAAIERSSFVGYESAADIEAFTDLLTRVDDLLIVFALLALGPSSAADLVEVATGRPGWTFNSTPFVGSAAQHLT